MLLAEQLLPGAFEFALNHLVDSGAVPLDAFDAFYRNDETGAPAVSPAVLLKVVLRPSKCCDVCVPRSG
ncbi:MAG: hypothetical protein QM702_05140 [Rubrivivax sp.]